MMSPLLLYVGIHFKNTINFLILRVMAIHFIKSNPLLMDSLKKNKKITT
jgi:hypothetical protein